MPNDVVDWSTIAFNNQLVLVGEGTFTTGTPAPSTFSFSFVPSITRNTLFDCFYLLITDQAGNTLIQNVGSTVDIYLMGNVQNTYKIRYNNYQGKYFEFDLDDDTPLLFDNVTFNITSAFFAANTTYSYMAYCIKLSQEVQAFNKQLLINETDGTISVANVWQQVYHFALKPDYILIQNQGTGYMYISIGTTATPTVTGMKILPGGSFISDTSNIPMNNSFTDHYLWIMGTHAGDAFALWAP